MREGSAKDSSSAWCRTAVLLVGGGGYLVAVVGSLVPTVIGNVTVIGTERQVRVAVLSRQRDVATSAHRHDRLLQTVLRPSRNMYTRLCTLTVH